jgi:alkanesulfonate monooxygenase SsuD/methylene tetrahydromethanopterin reductase-like flavin-dependent oxidoreductase (luciferase family)
VALGAVAAVTERVRLATGIYLVGLRHSLAVAGMTLTLHDVAGGTVHARRRRRVRFDEALAVLRAAWGGGEIAFAGEHVAFEHGMVTAPPVRVPLILGGNTQPALRRAARLGVIACSWRSIRRGCGPRRRRHLVDAGADLLGVAAT